MGLPFALRATGSWSTLLFVAGYGLTIGLPLGLPVGIIVEFTTYFREGDADLAATTDPAGLLRDDRRRAIATGVLLAAASMATLSIMIAIGFLTLPLLYEQSREVGTLALGLTAKLMVSFKGVIGAEFVVGLGYGVISSSWGWFQVARWWFASDGRLPRRIMTFLDDAHDRGVLRQPAASTNSGMRCCGTGSADVQRSPGARSGGHRPRDQ